MSDFEKATAVRAEGDDRYGVTLSEEWFVANGPNGGYLASVLMRALVARAGEGRPPRSLTVHYLSSSVAGDAVVETTAVREGRSLSFLEAGLRQGDKLVARAMAVFGEGRAPQPEFQDRRLPADLPGPDAVASIDAEYPPIAARFHYRPQEPREFFSGGPSEFWCWLRPRDPSPVDPVLLATHVDALVPAIVFRSRTPVLAPTLTLTVHFRQQPDDPAYDGWCVGHARTRLASGGFVEEDCDIYDASGRLLAQGRQLAMLVPLG